MLNENVLKQVTDFLTLAENLKSEMRHSWLSSGRQESVAEHSYQMALMVLITHSHLEKPVDLFKSLKMALYHDLVEAKTGDIPYMETGERQQKKAETELKAAKEIAESLPDGMGDDFLRIFHEYEERKSPEAKFVKALDHLEVQHQHNLAPLMTWTPPEYDLVYTKMNDACAHDSFLNALREKIADAAEKKMLEGGVNVGAIRKRLGIA